MPEVEVGVISPAEISFRCHGLEFARSRLTAKPGDFRSAPEIVFGAGPAERVLDGGNFPQFERLIRSIGEVRHAEGPRPKRQPLVAPASGTLAGISGLKNICALDDQIDPRWRYSQVPAF